MKSNAEGIGIKNQEVYLLIDYGIIADNGFQILRKKYFLIMEF